MTITVSSSVPLLSVYTKCLNANKYITTWSVFNITNEMSGFAPKNFSDEPELFDGQFLRWSPKSVGTFMVKNEVTALSLPDGILSEAQDIIKGLVFIKKL